MADFWRYPEAPADATLEWIMYAEGEDPAWGARDHTGVVWQVNPNRLSHWVTATCLDNPNEWVLTGEQYQPMKKGRFVVR